MDKPTYYKVQRSRKIEKEITIMKRASKVSQPSTDDRHKAMPLVNYWKAKHKSRIKCEIREPNNLILIAKSRIGCHLSPQKKMPQKEVGKSQFLDEF